MFLANPRVPRLGRPRKFKSPTEVSSGNETAVNNWMLFNVNLPPMLCRLLAVTDVTLVAPSTIRSPVIRLTVGILILPDV